MCNAITTATGHWALSPTSAFPCMSAWGTPTAQLQALYHGHIRLVLDPLLILPTSGGMVIVIVSALPAARQARLQPALAAAHLQIHSPAASAAAAASPRWRRCTCRMLAEAVMT